LSARPAVAPPALPERRLVLEDGSVFRERGFGSASATSLGGWMPEQGLPVKSWSEYRGGARG
jgi:hypothetical protein